MLKKSLYKGFSQVINQAIISITMTDTEAHGKHLFRLSCALMPVRFSHKMKHNRLFLTLLLLLTFSVGAWAERAKYVFYFIGDGMGVNQVNGAETYTAALEGRIGVTPLCFTQFPHAAFVTTYSGTNGVTDSAAAGTALATATKTKNGALGVKTDLTTPVNSVAVWAKNAGAAVGVGTSVSVDHATPAAFYAHVPKRKMYHEIGKDLIRADFDFYAGSDFLKPNKEGSDEPSLYVQCENAGYVLAHGYKDFQKKSKKAEKLILFQSDEANKRDNSSLPYAIDRTSKDMTLQDVTRAGIKFLTDKKKDGFFLMIEGGKIDWACHSNDAGTAFRELKDMDDAVKVAYEFYAQHPDETLIVITADHETGGISLGRGPYELHTSNFRFQRMSVEAYSKHLQEMRDKLGDKFTWSVVENDLKKNWGFGAGITLSEGQTKRLRKAYENTVNGSAKDKSSLYAKLNALSDAAREVMAETALIGWQSGGHSNGFVPVFAIGAGAEKFHGQIDNTEIPQKIAEAAEWKQM